MVKSWKYNISCTFTKNEIHYTVFTQLYKIGIYTIWNNNSNLQYNYTPNYLQKLFKRFKREFKNGEITDLKLGREIKVVEDEDGLYKEIK
jgi:hypothetical protein